MRLLCQKFYRSFTYYKFIRIFYLINLKCCWSKTFLLILCVLDRASYWYLNKGWPNRWHLLYYLLLNMFQTLIRPSPGACDYLVRYCVGWLKACWCYERDWLLVMWYPSVGWTTTVVVQPTLGYHITNRQSRHITSARLKSAYTTQQIVTSSWRWTY